MVWTRHKLSYILGCIILVTFAYAFTDTGRLIDAIYHTNIYGLLTVIFLFISSNILNGYVTNKLIIAKFGADLTPNEWIGLSFINTLANIILPMKSGTLIKAIYLKKKYRIDLSKSAAILLFSSYISIVTLLTLSATLIYYVNNTTNRTSLLTASSIPIKLSDWLFEITLIGSISTIILLLLAFIIPQTKSFSIAKLPQRINVIFDLLIQSTLFLAKSPLVGLGIAISAVINLFINIAVLHITFKCMGIPTDTLGLTIANLLNSIAFFISVTPGNLALQEIIISLSSLIMNIKLEEGLVAALLIRTCSTLVALIGGIFYYNKLEIYKFWKPQKNQT